MLDDLNTENKTVILRVDINSPVDPESGKLLDLTRIRSHLNTIEHLRESKLVLIGHQSRPGKADYVSLKSHAASMSRLLRRRVKFVDELIGQRAQNAIKRMKPGDVILLENVRFFAEEIALDKSPIDVQCKSNIVSNLAPLADYFVNDAFGAAHRAQPSLIGFTNVLPSAAGLLMEKEMATLNKVLTSDKHPCVVILGGAKAIDSMEVARNLLNNKIADKILTTGVVANLFLTAKGYDLGKPNLRYLESEFQDLKWIIGTAKDLLKKYNSNIETPMDLIGNNNGKRAVEYLESLPSKYQIFDIGLETIVKYSNILNKAKMIIANGPAGVFELDEFSFGTNEIFYAISSSKAYSVVGGGETIVAIDRMGIAEGFDHISTGGGACINYLAGRTLPAIEALKNSKKLFSKKIKKIASQ